MNKFSKIMMSAMLVLILVLPHAAEAKKKKHKTKAKTHSSRSVKRHKRAKHRADSVMNELPEKRVPSSTGYASAVHYLSKGLQD